VGSGERLFIRFLRKSVDDVANSAICSVRLNCVRKEAHHLALGSLPRLNVMQISKFTQNDG
jgi:hypothetical protein